MVTHSITRDGTQSPAPKGGRLVAFAIGVLVLPPLILAVGLSFSWDIDGGPGNSTSPIPGNATFTSVGTWDIELTVTNAEGIADPTPAKVSVTVLPVDAPPP